MISSRGYAAYSPNEPLRPFSFERREVGEHDVLIRIEYCGICHSDIHQARDEWGGSIFPMVPGHEIVGRVTEVGPGVTRYTPGDLVGVGCYVNSCRACTSCQSGLEVYCEGKISFTYNGTEQDGSPTYGGYSSNIVVDERYVLRVPTTIPPASAAPLLCAGITTYSPLRYIGVQKGQRIGVMGLGGLGHMAVKFAASFGAEVVVLSTSANKEQDARRLGAHDFVVTKNEAQMGQLAGKFDAIIDTVAAPHDINTPLTLLRRDGVLIMVGLPPEALPLNIANLIMRRRRIMGSLIGGIPETQEMLNYCGEKNIGSDVEIIAPEEINTAYERTIRGDVRYRFVIDMSKL